MAQVSNFEKVQILSEPVIEPPRDHPNDRDGLSLSLRAYLSRNCRAITWVSNYRNPTRTFCKSRFARCRHLTTTTRIPFLFIISILNFQWGLNSKCLNYITNRKREGFRQLQTDDPIMQIAYWILVIGTQVIRTSITRTLLTSFALFPKNFFPKNVLKAKQRHLRSEEVLLAKDTFLIPIFVRYD